MIVAVVGSRDWPDLERVKWYVTGICAKHPDCVIVSGGARGVDQMAEKIAYWSGVGLISYRPKQIGAEFTIETLTLGERAQQIVGAKSRRIDPPTFKSYGQAAFFRDSWIAQDCEVLAAFHYFNSKGTALTVRKAREFGRKVFVYEM